MGEGMYLMISAIFSIILVYWTAFLKLDEHRYCRDTGSDRIDTGPGQPFERGAEFSKVGEWALFWGRSVIRKPELQKVSLPSLPRRLPSLREHLPSLPRHLPSLPRLIPSLPGPDLFRPWPGCTVDSARCTVNMESFRSPSPRPLPAGLLPTRIPSACKYELTIN